ncbi:uncharacterized protein LOC114536722 [Dendronephthya gigantea]|uniref:uncharacterized protein LOC114536722 n=1 Tax=Dendronephthya gigantea TaxID=151771 RepID=UPI00106D8DF2|nr:uncharacterized protein LOC114536722 [Dendronephthya gigantea]
MDPDDMNYRKEQRQRGLDLSTAALDEIICSSKRSRAGFLAAVSRVRGQIEALLANTGNVQTVQTLNERYKDAWCKFEDSHNYYMSLLPPDSTAFYEAVEQFNLLLEEKAVLLQRVTLYLHDSAITLSGSYERPSSLLRFVKGEHAYAESITSRRSSLVSRSSTQVKRVEAAKANLALQLAEQERRRTIEGQLRLHEIEKKQRKLARQQKLEEEELESARKLEALKQEADRKLAEVRQQAAFMNLEAQLEEQIDGNQEIDMDLVSVVGGEIYEQQTGDIPFTYLYEDEIPPPYIENFPTYQPLQDELKHPVFAYQESSTPAVDVGSQNIFPKENLPSWTVERTNVAHSCKIPRLKREEDLARAQNSFNAVPQHSQQVHQPPVCSEGYQSILVPKVPSPTWLLASDVSHQEFQPIAVRPPENSLRTKASLYEHESHAIPTEFQTSREAASTLSNKKADVLESVASAMESITLVQQRLASGLNLPAIQLDKFSGSPNEFPLFKQRFQKRIMSNNGFDDGEKMLRLLQFLDGEAKEAVKSYEVVKGGVYEAMKVLEARYGRKCLVVSSIVESLTKGPLIAIRDRIALRKYSDDVSNAEATLRSLDCLKEVNQGNLVDMSHRLPRHLQEKFATLAHDLESKEQRFPTLSDLANFLNKWANVANHPVNTSKCNVPLKGRTDPALKLSTFATGLNSSKENSFRMAFVSPCPCCSQNHSIYRCELFKTKTQPERLEVVKKKGLCFNCLKSNPITRSGVKVKHNVQSCPSKFKCKADGCGLPHHTLLHKPKSFEKRKSEEIPCVENNAASLKTPDAVLLQVIPVRAIGACGVTTTTYAMLDSGSEITLVDPSLIEKLGVERRSDKLVVSTVSNENDLQHGNRVNLSIESLIDKDPQRLELTNAWSSKELKIPLRHHQALNDKSRWHHLQDIPFPDVERKKISIIIGTNVPEAFIPLDVRHCGPEAPVAIRSCLGYSILGRIGHPTNLQRSIATASVVRNVCDVADDASLNQQLESFWKLESFGTTRNDLKPTSVQDRKALKVIEETLVKVDGHYQMDLLWKDKDVLLPNNQSVAELRLRHLRRRLEQDCELKQRYVAAINDYIKKGYAKRLTKKEEITRTNKTWYLPHHPVVNPHKPGKVRAVFDAASKYGATSLNDQLLVGPDLTNNLVGILIRFRQDPVALIADIEAMFHQVKVRPEDCDALRFLWWDGDIQGPPVSFKMLVHIFGAKSSPCCANKALLQTADDNETKYGKDVADIVRHNFYVDDLLKSTGTVEDATRLARNLIDLLAEGGFRLTKFMSNRKEVLKSIPSKERATPALDLDLNKLPISRTLGLCWDADSDEFYFSSIKTDKPSTKRGILSVVSSLFDPLGFLLHLSCPPKYFFRSSGVKEWVGMMKYSRQNSKFGKIAFDRFRSYLTSEFPDVILWLGSQSTVSSFMCFVMPAKWLIQPLPTSE